MLVQIGPQKTFSQTDPADMDRMIERYFVTVSKRPISFKGVLLRPKPLVVSPLIFRELECPENCGACCRNDGKGLTYLPVDAKPAGATNRVDIILNDASYPLFYDVQPAASYCWNLDEKGRCMIYPLRPFACDLPPIQVNVMKNYNILTGRKLGRGNKLTRIDGEKGILTILHPPTSNSVNDVRRKLWRLKQWVDYFELHTWLPEIISWANQEPTPTTQLRLGF